MPHCSVAWTFQIPNLEVGLCFAIRWGKKRKLLLLLDCCMRQGKFFVLLLFWLLTWERQEALSAFLIANCKAEWGERWERNEDLPFWGERQERLGLGRSFTFFDCCRTAEERNEVKILQLLKGCGERRWASPSIVAACRTEEQDEAIGKKSQLDWGIVWYL